MDAWLNLKEPITAKELDMLDALLSKLGRAVTREKDREGYDKILDVRCMAGQLARGLERSDNNGQLVKEKHLH
jgi:hypothetical protein